MSNRKVWPNKRRYKQPIHCRLAREYPNSERLLRERKQGWSALQWLKRAESMGVNYDFTTGSHALCHVTRRHDRRMRAYYARMQRNAFERYRRLVDLT